MNRFSVSSLVLLLLCYYLLGGTINAYAQNDVQNDLHIALEILSTLSNEELAFIVKVHDKTEEETIEIATKLANEGNGYCANYLGNHYSAAGSSQSDYKKAFHWYSKAVELGYIDGYNGLGFLFENGFGTEKNEYQAFAFYTKAANEGVPNAYINLGQCYAWGIGTEQDLNKALEWFTKGTITNERVAFVNCGVILFVLERYEEAISYLEKSCEMGSPVAFFQLGLCYRDGKGVEKNEQKSRVLFMKAKELGYSED